MSLHSEVATPGGNIEQGKLYTRFVCVKLAQKQECLRTWYQCFVPLLFERVAPFFLFVTRRFESQGIHVWIYSFYSSFYSSFSPSFSRCFAIGSRDWGFFDGLHATTVVIITLPPTLTHGSFFLRVLLLLSFI